MKTHLGHYEILSELGRGGMGVVYKGYEAALGRYVAIKELSPALSHDPTLVERFLREARAMAALNDPHIVQIYFIGQADGQPFFAMEFIDGETLSGILKREGRLPVAEALKVLHQAAQGLALAHDHGVIHRDLKPGNLMITPRGQVKLGDFGIALANNDMTSKLTSTGEFVGTPGYLSPEVCLGKPVDLRSDLFALGIVLFEMLTGRTPFSDESPLKLMLDVVQSDIPDVRTLNGEVDTGTVAILAKLVAKEPADRYQSTHDLIAALAAHPLVAGGGPLKIRTAAPSPAAATLVGAPTPQTPARRDLTPPPQVATMLPHVSAPAAATPPPMPQAAAPAAARPAPVSSARRSSSLLPVALVGSGVGVLLLVGGVWAMRDRLFGPEMASSGEAGNTQVVAAASEPADDAVLAASDDAAFDDSDAAMPADTIADAAAAAPDTAAMPTAPGTPDGSVIASAPVPAVAARPAPAMPTPAARAPVAAASAPIIEPEPALGGSRGVRVVAIGDPALTIPAQDMVEQALADAGIPVGEGRGGLEIQVRVEPIGTQDVEFYGERATITNAYLSVRAYGPRNRPLGPGFRTRIDYTALNAEAKVQQALQPQLDRMVETVQSNR
jgi:serine/threonine-protein kinase